MLSRQLKAVTLRAAASRTCAIAPPALRTYAQAAPAQDAKPPVALYGLDGTYASALVCLRYPSPHRVQNRASFGCGLRVTDRSKISTQLQSKHQPSKPRRSP